MDGRRTTCAWLVGVGLSFAAGLSGEAGAAAADGAGLRASLERLAESDWIAEDAAYAPAPLGARQAAANEAGVTTIQDAAGGCDGVKNGKFGFHTASNEQDAWWQVDLGGVRALDRVVVFNRVERDSAARTASLEILVSADGERFERVYAHTGEPFHGVEGGPPLTAAFGGRDIRARVVRLQVPGRCSFALDEVEVYAADAPDTNIALGRPADQKSVGPYSYPGTRGVEPAVAPAAAPAKPEFSLEHTGEVIAKARGLYERLAAAGAELSEAGARLDAAGARLDAVGARLDAVGARVRRARQAGDVEEDERRELYLEARRVKRAIAFCNPLLDMDGLLFIERHDPRGLYHMVHQYYGFNAVAGGGLFVLSDPFGGAPRLENLLDGAVVENGRLAGQSLEGGSFLSPEVSYDGGSILFAYTEAAGEYLEWSPKSSYHILRVNADGSGLVQLTDGPYNDFDPCFLPDGGIAFISDRRGGYLRCGGSAPPVNSPTYTLHSMAADGSEITCLSFHETQEWHPSVNNSGMIVYTRWDYIDRDTNVAHHIWTCYPDGRDPRSFHGNYPDKRESRPWMEMSIRAIPGSHRYVATAAAHHGIAFGSLILIDPHREDDGAMSQVTRLTPEVPFPEAETEVKKIPEYMAYGTPWPLSEDDYLCVYGADAQHRGIYWLDRAGNRELVYADPDISCVSPIPLDARPCPPVIPRQTGSGRATVAVMNVYDSDFDWPEGARVAALRIIQVLPKTTPRADDPRIGIAKGTNARSVLGTVPVEADGSAHFEAPPGRLIYFQALDARGMAIQSMRSGTYLHPGERLTCRGCHERKYAATIPPSPTPLALQRAPSQIEPDVYGSHPFNYVRLVQPVLDKHCVTCHEEKEALDLCGDLDDDFGWSRSYHSLTKDHAFYFNASRNGIRHGVHGGSRTTPGAFGARASRLMGYLDEKHYGVSLSDEDFHRITLWLDCNSEFYGAYENVAAQSRGEVVWPTLN
ncbi:MAG: discoidin domain-containing protein [Candidatus Hydrogenedentes bacterium]|nr:discoidin domain-containing protein [Candidatus Hydrogenedentota bacterium]